MLGTDVSREFPSCVRPKRGCNDGRLRFGILSSVLIALLFASLLITQSQALPPNPQASSSYIKFKVVDADTDLPLQNATIIVWDMSTYALPSHFYTNGSGEYYFDGAVQTHLYYIYVYKGNLTEGTIQYAPQFISITLSYSESNRNVTVNLVPAAAIHLTGEISVVESVSPPNSFEVSIIDPTVGGDVPPVLNGDFIDFYGRQARYFLREKGQLNSSFVFVPAGIPLKLRFDFALITEKQTIVYLHFYIPVPPLENNATATFRLEDHSLMESIEMVKAYVFDAYESLRIAQDAGFYLAGERITLDEQLSQLNNASGILSGNDPERYEQCWGILRTASSKTDGVLTLLDYYISWAAANAVYLPAFFAVYSVIFAFFIFEDNRKKYISGVGFYGLFLLILYYVYPGIRIIINQQLNLFVEVAGASIAVTLGIVFLITRRWKLSMEGVFSMRDILATLFSLGKRQIKIRRARGFLTLSSLIILVLAFTALTSFGWVYGVTSERMSYTPRADGYLMKLTANATFVYGQTEYSLFTSMDLGYNNMLSQRVPLQQVAPKIETYPTSGSVATVISTTGTLDIRGVVGVEPVSEAIYTGLDTIIPAGNGDYLDSADPNGILISSEAAETLNVSPGEIVQFISSEGVTLNCTVKGIFSDTGYEQLNDLDGQPFGPKTAVVRDGRSVVELCNATNVVFMNWQTAIDLQKQINYNSQPRQPENARGKFNMLSRIAFRVQSGYGLNELIEVVVNNLYCDLYVAEGGALRHYFVGFYYESKGAVEILFPLVMACLNVGAVMLNAVYERRREMKILTVMGSNPAHLAMLFVSEAIILGMVGGGLGYLFGLGFYRVMAVIGEGVVVREKLEWWWSALGFALAVIASVLSTLRPALLAVKMYTPSKVRRVKATKEEKQTRKDEILKFYQARSMTMPVKVNVRDAIFFFNLMHDRLDEMKSGFHERIEDLQELPEAQTSKGHIVKKFTFTYSIVSKDKRTVLKNEVICNKNPDEDYYRVQLVANLENLEVHEEQIHRIAEIIRGICLDWSKNRSQIVG